MDFGDGVLLDDTTIVSSGILEFGDVGSSPSDEGESMGLVKTGVGAGLVTTGENEGMSGGRATDSEHGTRSTIGQGARSSCLLTRDLRGRPVDGPESFSFLAGRHDGSPKSVQTLNG